MTHVSTSEPTPHPVVGWDIGGAHVKACLMQAVQTTSGEVHHQVHDVAEWACPLWQGLGQLEQVLAQAHERWPALNHASHAITMTGEMVDLFANREEGVHQIAALLAGTLTGPVHFFAGDAGWCTAQNAAAYWAHIASANWLATAWHVATALSDDPQRRHHDAVLVDIGTTTTDLIALRGGLVLTRSRTDNERLSTGELVYQGVVRTPLCALARRMPFRGQHFNVMNEYFSTTADVYRLTGDLAAQHDLYPAADNADKSTEATQQRLARMIGLDARDAAAEDWVAFACAWRRTQLDEINGQLQRVMALHALTPDTLVVSAGCGDFLAAHLTNAMGVGWPQRQYGRDIVRLSSQSQSAQPELVHWAQVCAPSVAVATLFERAHR